MKLDIFQWLIDASQRQPHWWCRQCTIGAALTFAMAEFYRPEQLTAWHYIGLFTGMVWLCSLWVSSASATTAVHLDLPRSFRIFIWSFAGVAIFALFNDPSEFRFLFALEQVMFASIYSFAACRPPAPPKRKREALRLSIGGAA